MYLLITHFTYFQWLYVALSKDGLVPPREIFHLDEVKRGMQDNVKKLYYLAGVLLFRDTENCNKWVFRMSTVLRKQ